MDGGRTGLPFGKRRSLSPLEPRGFRISSHWPGCCQRRPPGVSGFLVVPGPCSCLAAPFLQPSVPVKHLLHCLPRRVAHQHVDHQVPGRDSGRFQPVHSLEEDFLLPQVVPGGVEPAPVEPAVVVPHGCEGLGGLVVYEPHVDALAEVDLEASFPEFIDPGLPLLLGLAEEVVVQKQDAAFCVGTSDAPDRVHGLGAALLPGHHAEPADSLEPG